MSKKHNKTGALPEGLPDNFFDLSKKSKKTQEDDLTKELEQFEKEMAALQAESDEQMKEEFDKLQDEKNIEELDQQMNQWKKIIELEKRAEELKNKPLSEKPTKKFKNDSVTTVPTFNLDVDDEFGDLDDIENFEDKLSNWRSKSL